MSKRHDAVFDDILKDMAAPEAPKPAAPVEARTEDRAGARFLNRQNALSDTSAREEKLLRWVDPERCVMWERHNRAYDQLTEENCRELIDSIKAQGRQEFPAVVRRLSRQEAAARGADYEVVCGARRHFAVTWLRDNNYPQFRYLIEERDLTDEEAFRLADIENRDREDLSDLERARDYASALDLYYGGRQKTMAERLEVSEAWLSRYLQLARLPEEVVAAFASIRDIKELHARALRPMLADAEHKVIAEARALAAEQARARDGQGEAVHVAKVLARLKSAWKGPKPEAGARGLVFRRSPHESGVVMRRKGKSVSLEFSDNLSEAALRAALEAYLIHRFRG
ncbi:ParB/RepB/Spo0J family partition protein [Frigidibacter sp. MR17.14]|uniref:ParB/RepB/Spo0J family partition protein n=1 Tax=Frigidibacter sp. MR17.14 TaxID=3126509 RepID=UPI00301300BB